MLGESFNVWTSDGGRLGSAVALGLILIIFCGLGSAVRQRRAYANGLQRQAASRAPDLLMSTQTAAGGERPSGAPLRPAPGLADLDRLITRVGHAGVHVTRHTGRSPGLKARFAVPV